MGKLSQLSNEVVELVLKQIPHTKEGQATLNKFSQTSKQFHPVAMRLLYQQIILSTVSASLLVSGMSLCSGKLTDHSEEGVPDLMKDILEHPRSAEYDEKTDVDWPHQPMWIAGATSDQLKESWRL